MKSFQERVQDLVLQLHDVGALKFGDFTMKIGKNSPVYFDLRVMVSFPQIMETLSQLMFEFIKLKNLSYDRLCGVPYTALPIATLISVQSGVPMLMRRKEAKKYGTKKLIEGHFKPGENALIVEDVCTSGSSILETFNDLQAEGLVTTDAIVVVDRQQGGFKNLADKGLNIHPLVSLSEIMDVLFTAGRVDADTVKRVNEYTNAVQIDLSITEPPVQSSNELRISIPFSKRSLQANCSLAAKLFNLMEEKQSNMCVAADVTSSTELLELAEAVGPYIAIFKTHIDMLTDFTQDTAFQLKHFSRLHNFLIMEDRKFADIGETVRRQYCALCPWADLVTAHSLPGEGVLEALKRAFTQSGTEPKGVFVVAQLSSSSNLISSSYTRDTVKLAEPYSDIVAGYVCQTPDVVPFAGQIQLTPGVKFSEDSDGLGQQYLSPEVVVGQNGADIAVVGRGITKSDNIQDTAKRYQKILWTAYQNRIKKC